MPFKLTNTEYERAVRVISKIPHGSDVDKSIAATIVRDCIELSKRREKVDYSRDQFMAAIFHIESTFQPTLKGMT